MSCKQFGTKACTIQESCKAVTTHLVTTNLLLGLLGFLQGAAPRGLGGPPPPWAGTWCLGGRGRLHPSEMPALWTLLSLGPYIYTPVL